MKSKLFVFGSLAALFATNSQAATAIKGATGTDLSSTLVGVWSGGGGTNGSPNAADAATWDAASTTGALTVDNNVSWGQISFPAALAATTTLSGIGIIELNVVDTATGSTWALANTSGKAVTINNPISFVGSGRHTIACSNNGSASSTLNITGNVTSPNTLFVRGNSQFGTTISGVITVPTTLTKADTGHWTLTNANSIGSVSFGGGTIRVGNDTALGTGTVTIANASCTLTPAANMGDRTLTNNFTTSGFTNQTLTVDTGNANMRINGNITDSGSLALKLTKNGGNTLTLAGANTFTGVLAVNAGGLSFLNTNAQPATGTTTVAANATLGLGVSSSSPFSEAQLNELLAGTLVPAVTMDPAALVGIDTTGGDFSYTPDAVYARGLTKLGTDTLTLNGANAHTGATSVLGGTLALGNTYFLNDSAAVIVDAATAVLSFGVNNDTVGAVSLKKGGQITGSGVLTGSSYAFENGSVSAILGGSGVALTKTTADTVTLSNTNTFTGGTTLSGGIIQANASGALGSGTVTFSGGRRVSLGNGVTLANPITIGTNNGEAGRGLIQTTGVVSDTATLEGAITINNNASSGGHFANLGTGTFNIKGAITSSVSVVQRQGAVTYWNGGSSSYTNMSVTGTAALGADNGLDPDATVLLGASEAGVIDLAGFDQTLVGVTRGTNPFSFANILNSSTTDDSVLTITGTSVYTGNILGDGTKKLGLTVNSGAAFTLSGINTYTGDTIVNNTGSLTLADNAQLRFLIDATSGTNNTLTGTGTATIDGDFNIDTTLTDASSLTSGTWTLENVTSPTYNGTFQVLSGTTPWDNSGDEWSKTVGARTYTFNRLTGILTLTSVGYASWAASNGLTGTDANFDADPDNDGLDNGLEFVLGGQPNPANPNSNSNDLLPKVAQAGGDMSFTFNREDLSEAAVALTFQWSTDLTFPSPANDIPVGLDDSVTDTIVVDVTEDDPDADTDKIVITVPAAKAVGGKVFGRLMAVELP
jgi:autotransporter-associated beta strand protein